MGRPPCCDKSNVKRGLWTPEEDAKILAYVSNHGIGNWTLVPKKAGLNRCGKSCRLRWTNYLRPDLKHDNFTPQEEELIINLHAAIGSRWSLIAKRLPGRTDNDVKNYWNTKLRKKLMKMGIDPVTHKPVTQVLSDLGSISGIPNTNSQNSFAANMLPTRTEPLAPSSGMDNNAGSRKNPIIVLEQAQSEAQDQVHSWEQQQHQQHQVLLQQYQVLQPHVLSEAAASSSSLSSPSSSSSNLTQLSSPHSYACQTSHSPLTPPCPSFDWSEFLYSDEPFMSSLKPSGIMQSEGEVHHNNNNNNSSNGNCKEGVASEVFGAVACEASNQCEGHCAASGDESFVDGILDRDNEIRAAFPELLDASFDF